MNSHNSHRITIDLDPQSATTAIGIAQLCMLRFFEEMNLQPKEQRLFDARTQKRMMRVLSKLYKECMDASGIRNIIENRNMMMDLNAMVSHYSNYMGISGDFPESLDRAV